MIRCLYSLYFRTLVPAGCANLVKRGVQTQVQMHTRMLTHTHISVYYAIAVIAM